MRVSSEAKLAFAKSLQAHNEEMDALFEDLEYNLFKRFQTASEDERKVIGDMTNVAKLFKAELNKQIADSVNVNE